MNCHTQVKDLHILITFVKNGIFCQDFFQQRNDVFLKPSCLLVPSGCSSLPVSPRGWLHDSFQSSSRTEQVQSSTCGTRIHDCKLRIFTITNLFPVTMPWTHSMTTSGTWPFWSIWLVSLQRSHALVVAGNRFNVQVKCDVRVPQLCSDIHHKRGETEKRQIAVRSRLHLTEMN